MKSKNFAYKSMVAAISMAAAFSFTACGDEPTSASPSGNEPTTVSSSSIANVPVSEGVVSSSSPTSSAATPATETANGCAAGQVPTPVAFPQDKFNDIGEVYKNIQCNEKVVFIVRHGKRESQIGNLSSLTIDGYEDAVAAGQKLVGAEPFKYIFSGMVRTYQTAASIATGRGDVACTADYAEAEDGLDHLALTCTPEFKADTLTQLKDGWYLKDKTIRDAYIAADTTDYLKNSNVMITDWVYQGNYADAFYDLDERSKEFVALLVKDYNDMPKYTLAASHDQVLMPLTAWATDKKIDLKLHDPASRNWLNYLAGVAIIINDKNEQRYAAIKGMNDKVLPDGTVLDGGVQ